MCRFFLLRANWVLERLYRHIWERNERNWNLKTSSHSGDGNIRKLYAYVSCAGCTAGEKWSHHLRVDISFLPFHAAACKSSWVVTDAKERSPNLMHSEVTNACKRMGDVGNHMLGYIEAKCVFLNNFEVNNNYISGMYSFSWKILSREYIDIKFLIYICVFIYIYVCIV